MTELIEVITEYILTHYDGAGEGLVDKAVAEELNETFREIKTCVFGVGMGGQILKGGRYVIDFETIIENVADRLRLKRM